MGMTKRWSVAAVVVLTAAVAWAEAPTPVALSVGTQKVLTVKGLLRVAVGDTDVADVKPIGDSQLLVTGIGPGVTTLLAWTSKKAGQPPVQFEITVSGDGADGGGGEEQHVKLFVGELKALEFQDIARVAVGNPDVADVRVEKKDVLLTGASAGTTTVLVWTHDEKPHSVLVTVADAVGGEPWTLEVGGTREVPRPAKVGVSDWDVCHLEDTPTAIVLRGHSAGTAAVTVTGQDGKRVRHVVTVKAPAKK